MAKEKEQYFEGVGRRKRAVARVRITQVKKDHGIRVNKKQLKEYFHTPELITITNAPLEVTGTQKNFSITAHIKGGGQSGQADAFQLGLSRALVKFNGEFQKSLRDLDYLKRDPRKKERKKPGLKKARKSPQWSKR